MLIWNKRGNLKHGRIKLTPRIFFGMDIARIFDTTRVNIFQRAVAVKIGNKICPIFLNTCRFLFVEFKQKIVCYSMMKKKSAVFVVKSSLCRRLGSIQGVGEVTMFYQRELFFLNSEQHP